MRKEYALGASHPNPYAKRLGDRGRAVLEQRYFESEGYVRLDADVARAFTDADSVNEALRLVVRLRKVGEAPRRKTRRSSV